MSVAQFSVAEAHTLAELVQRLGDIPLSRIRLHPPPGTATEEDVAGQTARWCELIDGVLVEKPVGYFEARLAAVLVYFLERWLTTNDVGYVNGEGALTRLTDGNVRVPDVSVVCWSRVGEHRVPRDAVCSTVPNFAVEILSKSNTHREMERKRQEYFETGVELLWIVEPELATVEVWSSAKACRIVDGNEELDGGSVLPGFRLMVRDWFDRASGNRPA